MSMQAMVKALDIDIDDTLARYLYLVLANYADEKGRAYPTQERLTMDTRMAERSIRNKLGVLVDAGLLEIVQQSTGAGNRNVYLLTVARPEGSNGIAIEREKVPTPQAKQTLLPKDWQPSESLIQWAQEKYPHIGVSSETEKFKDYWHNRGSRRSDWNAGWRTWIRNASDYAGRRKGAAVTARNVDAAREYLASKTKLAQET